MYIISVIDYSSGFGIDICRRDASFRNVIGNGHHMHGNGHHMLRNGFNYFYGWSLFFKEALMDLYYYHKLILKPILNQYSTTGDDH